MAQNIKLSYMCTPNAFPCMYQTVPDRLRHLAAVDPDREAFIYYDINKQRTSLTRKQLLDKSTNVAKILVKSGLKKGSNVAFCMSNSIEMLITNMGVIMAGGIPFYYASNLKDGSDLVEFMKNLEAEFLFLDTTGDDGNWKILENIWPIGGKSSESVPSLKMILCNGSTLGETETHKYVSSLLAGNLDDAIVLPVLQPEDTLAYFCTSGTSGKPKEVTYTHFCILNWTKVSNIPFGIKEESIFFCERTFSWVVGFPRTYLAEGSTRVFIDPKLSADGKHTDLICDVIEKERCDVVYLPGYLTADLLKNHHMGTKFKNVKTIFMAGERVLKASCDGLRRDFCKRVLSYYGTTETGGASVYIPDTDDWPEDGIIGQPLQGVEMKVIDDLGGVVPAGTKGELCIRCPWRFAGYRFLESLFRESVDTQNWFHTGDVAHLRHDGNYVVDGRKKEMISTGGNKYFPWTIERTLKNIQGAANAFAVGVPDPRLGQVVCAVVVPQPGFPMVEGDVKKFCDDSFLEESTSMGVGIKPRYFIILDKVPLTRSGKVDRGTIILHAKEKLGL